jgi:hypothetical protein
MRGEGFCRESPDDGGNNDEHPYHCLHMRHRQRDFVCCWCGLLFHDHDFDKGGAHGQYRPRRGRPRKDGSIAMEPRAPTSPYRRPKLPIGKV